MCQLIDWWLNTCSVLFCHSGLHFPIGMIYSGFKTRYTSVSINPLYLSLSSTRLFIPHPTSTKQYSGSTVAQPLYPPQPTFQHTQRSKRSGTFSNESSAPTPCPETRFISCAYW